ncbi:hypothetical protein ACFPOB_20465 [Bosea eneae]|uniref:Uncharacterized protein n=1 Tax=Bosea eneae TaxID=151454 RepID=A0ABW0IXA6_9HYPH
MKWWQFNWSPLGRQRQQLRESLARIEEDKRARSMRELKRAMDENEEAALAVQAVGSRRIAEGRPLRALLQDLIERVSEEQRSLRRKDQH